MCVSVHPQEQPPQQQRPLAGTKVVVASKVPVKEDGPRDPPPPAAPAAKKSRKSAPATTGAPMGAPSSFLAYLRHVMFLPIVHCLRFSYDSGMWTAWFIHHSMPCDAGASEDPLPKADMKPGRKSAPAAVAVHAVAHAAAHAEAQPVKASKPDKKPSATDAKGPAPAQAQPFPKADVAAAAAAKASGKASAKAPAADPVPPQPPVNGSGGKDKPAKGNKAGSDAQVALPPAARASSAAAVTVAAAAPAVSAPLSCLAAGAAPSSDLSSLKAFSALQVLRSDIVLVF